MNTNNQKFAKVGPFVAQNQGDHARSCTPTRRAVMGSIALLLMIAANVGCDSTGGGNGQPGGAGGTGGNGPSGGAGGTGGNEPSGGAGGTGGGSSSSGSGGSPNWNGMPSKYMSGQIPNAVYIGRWDFSGEYDRSFYAGAMIKVDFTGTTAKIDVKPWKPTLRFAYRIDGNPLVKVSSTAGDTQINLTPQPLNPGTHTLMIAAGGHDTYQATEILEVKGLLLDPGAQTLAPKLSNAHLEVIGDSISTGWGCANQIFDNYGWLIGEELAVEHTHITWSGISLGGMSGQYYKTGTMFDSPGNWDFSAYQPKVVVINLGQNGGGDVAGFKEFFGKVRAVYPDAYILPVTPFMTSTAANLKNIIAQAVTEMADSKIVHIDSTGGLSGDVLHPLEMQNREIADHLKPIVAEYMAK